MLSHCACCCYSPTTDSHLVCFAISDREARGLSLFPTETFACIPVMFGIGQLTSMAHHDSGAPNLQIPSQR